MTIQRSPHDKVNPYVMLNKELLQDPDLSWAAKGLLSYLLSLPNDWKIQVSHLSKIYGGKGGGEKAIYSLLHELIDVGYCERVRIQNEKGHFISTDYHITEFKKSLPLSSQRDAVEGDAFERDVVEGDTTNTQCIQNNKTIVCSVGAPPKEGVRSCEKTLCSGEKKEIKFDDVITQSIMQNCHDFTMEEMEEAWKILVAYQDPIRDWWKFIEGIIKKNRLKKHTGNNQCQKKQQTTNSQNQTEKKPQQKQNLEKQSNNDKETSSEKDTSVHILANYWEEWKRNKKSSTS